MSVTGRRRAVLTVLFAGAMAVLVLWHSVFTRAPAGVDAVRGLNVRAQTSQAPLQVTPAGAVWNGHPVYRLANNSVRPLSHLQVFSWSNEPLPILWTGSLPPGSFTAVKTAVPPPVTLAPRETAWFELADPPPQTVTVLWLAGGHAVYETLRVRR